MMLELVDTARQSSRRSRGRRGIGLVLGSLLLALVGTFAATGTAHADTYTKAATATLSGRTITLWLNDDNGQWHGEISGASNGDKIHLDYTNDSSQAKSGGNYSVASTTVAGATYANTSDHAVEYARACGFVGSSSKCTPFEPA